MKMKTMTALAAAVFAVSGAAHADTVKQIWNQGLDGGNPGRIVSPDECQLDSSSPFACWNERDELESIGQPVEEPQPEPDPEPESPTDQSPV